METLFEKDGSWTTLSNDASRRIAAALSPIMEELAAAGHSTRDIAYVVHSTASEVELRIRARAKRTFTVP